MIRLTTDSTWHHDAKEKGEWTIYNIRLLARYQRLLAKAKKENGNIQYWETRIRNLISKNP
jgi:GT2 family glycosyltransferase